MISPNCTFKRVGYEFVPARNIKVNGCPSSNDTRKLKGASHGQSVRSQRNRGSTVRWCDQKWFNLEKRMRPLSCIHNHTLHRGSSRRELFFFFWQSFHSFSFILSPHLLETMQTRLNKIHSIFLRGRIKAKKGKVMCSMSPKGTNSELGHLHVSASQGYCSYDVCKLNKRVR